MMLFSCCCSKQRDDPKSLSPSGKHVPETFLPGFSNDSKLKSVQRILLEFVGQEAKLGLRDVEAFEILEKLIQAAQNRDEINKKEVVRIYRETLNPQEVKQYLVQDFFFTDNTRSRYSYSKVAVFNLLYAGGTETDKANFLFNLMESGSPASTQVIQTHSQKLLTVLEILTFIPCITVGEILKVQSRFESGQEEDEFIELLALYSTNAHMIKEFALHLESTYIFPVTFQSTQQRQPAVAGGKQYLSRKEFIKVMEQCGYIILKPNEIRKKYTEFVLFNKARALLPSRKKGISKEEKKQVNRSLQSEFQNKSIEESIKVRESKTKKRGQDSHNEYSDSVTPGLSSRKKD